MKKLLLTSLLVASTSIAAPFVITDATTQKVTHCGLYLDATTPIDVPVATDITGSFCKFDINSVSTGVHIIKATFVNIDPVWGRSESVTSAPLTFTKPDSVIQNVPDGLVITP